MKFIYKGFPKALESFAILSAFTFLQTIKTDPKDGNYDALRLESKKIDLCLMRWFSKAVDNFKIGKQEEAEHIEYYGIKNQSLLPTLRTDDAPYYLPRDSRKYHLAILEEAVTLKTASKGFAILQLKYLAILNAVNYANCALYTNHYSLPTIRYCKEIALTLLDFSLMGTDVLCFKVAALFEQENIKDIFTNFSVTLTRFNNTFRRSLEDLVHNKDNSKNNPGLVSDLVGRTSEDFYYNDLRFNENKILLPAVKQLSNFLRRKKLDETLPSITTVIYEPFPQILDLWLKAESVYQNSRSSDRLNFMKLLANCEIAVAEEFKLLDKKAICDLKSIQGDYELDMMTSDNKIVVHRTSNKISLRRLLPLSKKFR